MVLLTRVPGFLESIMHRLVRYEPVARHAWLLPAGLAVALLPVAALGAEVPPWTVVESSAERLILRLDPAGPLRLEPGAEGGDPQVGLDGFGWTQEVGAPRLPRLSLRVALPSCSDWCRPSGSTGRSIGGSTS